MYGQKAKKLMIAHGMGTALRPEFAIPSKNPPTLSPAPINPNINTQIVVRSGITSRVVVMMLLSDSLPIQPRFIPYVVVLRWPTTIGGFVPSKLIFAGSGRRPISGEPGENGAC
jgi:hypothetical protein